MNPIRSRNRHLASRAVRRLGFTPIPGRRFNSCTGSFVSMAAVGHGCIDEARKNFDRGENAETN